MVTLPLSIPARPWTPLPNFVEIVAYILLKLFVCLFEIFHGPFSFHPNVFCVCCVGHDFVETYLPNDDDELSRLPIDDGKKIVGCDQGSFPRFRVASKSEYQLER